MTSNRNLGPVLAGIGCAVVTAAVVAGFFVVGGPGDARAERLDALTTQKLSTIAGAAQCVYVLNGAAPQTIGEIKAAAAVRECDLNRTTLDDLAGIDYSAKDRNHIELCATFQRPSPKEKERPIYPAVESSFPELNANRPTAGRHCFEVKLPERMPERGYSVVR